MYVLYASIFFLYVYLLSIVKSGLYVVKRYSKNIANEVNYYYNRRDTRQTRDFLIPMRLDSYGC